MSVFIEPLTAKPDLIIFGAGHIWQDLARPGIDLGFKVYVADPRESLLQQKNFDAQGNPRVWPGRVIPGNIKARGTWLQPAMRNEAEILDIETRLYRGEAIIGWR